MHSGNTQLFGGMYIFSRFVAYIFFLSRKSRKTAKNEKRKEKYNTLLIHSKNTIVGCDTIYAHPLKIAWHIWKILCVCVGGGGGLENK